ncbi:MAG: AI-2E family transporter [Desulfobacteraceae bacterium]|nr:AI-2E family transporter [Desulfobacteraceae bacterium]
MPQNQQQGKKFFQPNPHYFLFFLMGIVFLGCFSIIRPYIHTILLALILSSVASPVHRQIETVLGNRKNLSAAVSCLLLTIVVVIPLVFLMLSLIQQGVSSFNAMYDWIADEKYKALLEHPLTVKLYAWVNAQLPDVRKIFPDLNLTDLKIDKLVLDTTSKLGKTLLNQGGQLVGNIGSFIGKFCLMIFTFFFLIRDESRILNRVLHLVPMSRTQEMQIILKIKEIAKSALLGTFVTAMAQGLAGGIAFYICGLPGLFWGMVMAFASLIPMVGTALVWVPAAVYLVLSGSPWLSLFLVIWCIIIVGGIDNFLRPLFMQNGSEMNTLLIFFSILGGINSFGLLGLLYGPLLFGLAIVLLYIYGIEFKSFLSDLDRQ